MLNSTNSNSTSNPNKNLEDPSQFCQKFKTCADCVVNHPGHSICFWCSTTKSCISSIEIKNSNHACTIKTIYTGNCHVPITGAATIAIIIFFSLIFCAVITWCKLTKSCCYNKTGSIARIQMQEQKFNDQRENQNSEHQNKMNERLKKMDEIRKKHGLAPKNEYQVMDE